MAVGIRISFEVNGRQVAVFRTADGFEMDLIGDGQTFIPAADLAEALRFLDRVGAGLEECERAYVALTGRMVGENTPGIMQLQPGGSQQVTAVELAAGLVEVPVNGNGKVHGEIPGAVVAEPEKRKQRRPATPEQRELVARLSLEGKHSVQAIAEAAGLSPSTVYAIRAAVSRAVDAEAQKEAEQTPVGEGFRRNGVNRYPIDPAEQTDGNR